MICELMNPSDAITFIVDDVTVAGVAIIILGQGKFGLSDESGKTVAPLMLFGGAPKWLEEHGVPRIDEYIRLNAIRMADFLDTCCYGSLQEREAFDVALSRMTQEAADEHRAWWNDRQRSSLNNIGAAAANMAKALRKRYAGEDADLVASPPIVLVGS